MSYLWKPKAVSCPRQCLWIVSLLVVVAATLCASLWAFAYQSAPSSASCWVIPSWTRGSFKNESTHWYKGLEGTDVRLAWEEDSDFGILHSLYVTAVTVSAIGLLWSIREWQKVVARKRAFHSYIAALTFYFIVGFSVNLITHLCFVRNRCNDHNVHYLLPDDAIPAGARFLPMEGWIDISSFSTKLAKALYLTMTLVGGFLANTMLECALLQKVHTIGSPGGLNSCLKCTKLFNLMLLSITVLALPVAFWIFMNLMEDGTEAIGGFDTGVTLTLLFNIGAALFIAFHVFIALVLMVTFVTPSKLRWSGCRVPVCTCIIILSTLCCYGNMVVMLGNAYVLLPADSIINNVCMMILCFWGNSEEDSNVAIDEQSACEDGKCINDYPMKQGALSDVIGQSAISDIGERRPSTHSIHSVISAIGEALAGFGSRGSEQDYMPCTPRGDASHAPVLVASSTPSTMPTPHTPVLVAPSTPSTMPICVHDPLTPMSVSGDFRPQASSQGDVVLPPLTPVSVSRDFEPNMPFQRDCVLANPLTPGEQVLPPLTPVSVTGDSKPNIFFQGGCVLTNPSTPVSIADPRTPGATSDQVNARQPGMPEISNSLLQKLQTMKRRSTLDRKQVSNEARRASACSAHVPDEFDY